MRTGKRVRIIKKIREESGRWRFVYLQRNGNRYVWDARPGTGGHLEQQFSDRLPLVPAPALGPLHFINTLTFRASAGGHSMLCPYSYVGHLEMQGRGRPKFATVHPASTYT